MKKSLIIKLTKQRGVFLMKRLVLKEEFFEKFAFFRYERLEKDRLEKGLDRRSLYGEALSCYFTENYVSSFLMGYVYLMTPIVVAAKRLYRSKKQSTSPDDYKLQKCLEACYFLSDHTKNDILEEIKFTFKLNEAEKEFSWPIWKIRNATLHVDHNWHQVTIEQFDYKRVALRLLHLAERVHNEQLNYRPKNSKEKKRKDSELKRVNQLCGIVSKA